MAAPENRRSRAADDANTAGWTTTELSRRRRPLRHRARQVLAAIGTFWDGNEVWLLASGGALFVAFPRVLTSGISGFYFAI